VELFERIRRDSREEGVSTHGISRRHRVHKRTVRQALRSALPPPRLVAEFGAQVAEPTVRACVTRVRRELE